jgi:Protein of unknown function (DUF2750)
MSNAAAQASEFYREVAQSKAVWTVRDDSGFPAPLNADGKRAQPFWSSKSRVESVIAGASAYSGFTPVEISWADFETRWVPGLESDGILAGVNWSGSKATGYDIEPSALRENVRAREKR